MQPIGTTLFRTLAPKLPLVAVALAAACGDPVPVPTTVTISPNEGLLWALDDTIRLSATATDADGQVVQGVDLIWSSEDESVATVDAAGLVRAAGNGMARVRAEAEPVVGYATIGVDLQRGWLRAFYEATGGENWGVNDNWVTDAPLGRWHGVTTDSEGNVTGLTLFHNGLTGAIPPELGGLEKLEDLWLFDNQLTGAIPPELVDLDNLERLYLDRNQLTGSIPPELGDLENLERLHLDSNQLAGSIPPELVDLENLEVLRLGGNQLTGSIPPELGDIETLSDIRLGGNQLTGAIPSELGGLENLWGLRLDGNQLTGTLPPELGGFEKLEVLWLRDNQLTGPIPDEFVALPLNFFYWQNTKLCAPATAVFQEWLRSILAHEGGETCPSQ